MDRDYDSDWRSYELIRAKTSESNLRAIRSSSFLGFKKKFLEPKRMHLIAKSHQDRIHFRRGKIRSVNVEDDRLSNLSDDLIHKVLSFISVRQAIRTSVLSSRWRSIWTSMPYLNFSTQDLYPQFVSNVFSGHNNQIQVYSVKLVLGLHFCYESFKRVLEYTFSQNVQQLTATYAGFPLSLFTSRSLEHLTLNGDIYSSFPLMVIGAWDLPALTTLHLNNITLFSNWTGLFSKCTNLKNLSISRCRVKNGMNVLNICHPRLSNLTLEHTNWWVKAFNVVAPQLENLTITHCYGKHLISTPGLTSFVIKGDHPLQLSTQALCSLEKVDLCIIDPLLEDVHKIIFLLHQLHNVKFLTLNLEILELLSSSMGLISHQPFAFANIKILKFSMIHPIRVYLEVQAHEKVTNTSTEIKSHQLDTSPSAIFTVVSCEEIRIVRDMVSAQKVIAELRVVVKQCKTLEQRKTERLLMTKLQHIDGLLTELPASKRDVMQATFSSVCEEADVVVKNMLVCMKIRYNKKRKR